MRKSMLSGQLTELGARFRERQGVEVTAGFHEAKAEYTAIRDGVGLTDFSFLQKFRLPTDEGLDLLDDLLAGNVAKIRFGRMLHTLLADDDGKIIADCYVANNDEELIFLCESIVPDADVRRLIMNREGAANCVEDLTEDHVVLSLDGFRAWEVAKEVFGSDVLGLPYLSVEVYPFADGSVRLFRVGKTSEFGYLIMAPRELAPALLETLRQKVADCQGLLCGVDIHDDLRLEGRFFNIHAEGARVGDPLVLGLQWMIDFEKESFRGGEAIHARRGTGLQEKIIGVSTAEPLAVGDRIFHGGDPVASVVAGCHSHLLARDVGLAVFPVEIAFAGLGFHLKAPDGPEIRTISMPPIMPKSLSVKLDEM